MSLNPDKERFILSLCELVVAGEINKMEAARRLQASEWRYKNLESARGLIRGFMGASNKCSLKPRMQHKSTIAEGLAAIKKAKAKELQNITLKDCKTFIMSDVHLPHHDVEAVSIALNRMAEYQPDVVILNGDIVDFYQISRWETEPGAEGVDQELIEFEKFIRLIKQITNAKIYYILGNHEMRLRSYLLRKAKELFTLPQLSYESLFKAKEYDITIVENEPIKLGKLNVMHGHEFGESVFSPVNPARGLFLRAKTNAIIGHHHQPSFHSESNMSGEDIGCWSLGCLCSLRPDYRPFAFTKWRHGFAEVEVDSDGGFFVTNRQIVRGKLR
jgi:predicted phosphodiesterase